LASGQRLEVKLFFLNTVFSSYPIIGIAQEDATASQQVKVATFSTFSKVHTALTIGESYYTKDGVISTNPT